MKNGWLVRHENGEGSFCWARHEFKVVADKEAGEYRCECRQWEHTGLFCMHIIRAFTHLQVRKIPEKYMLKRRSDRAFEKTDRQLDNITPGIEMFPRCADGESSDPGASATGSVTTEGASSALHNEMLLIEPPVSRTKGRNPGKQKKNGVEPPLPLSTYTRQNYGDRECSTCGVRGTHSSTTCPINIDRSKAAEKRATKRVPIHKMAPRGREGGQKS
ncbi:uncharacterized protein C2845_PM05G22190 [Panicum miliaceum]|uniref:SWIM-type domain-containing protein n=1 Tax=Panicum miliaceum TaxID=4540 RepID=A0A3L6SUG8_PANMI|nr:uncharacterized protein C2845_PM05G22190 [Panicum miliaceum]